MRKFYSERLPKRFTQNITGLYAEKGGEWLEELPDLIVAIAEKWSLEVGNYFPNLSFNFVAPCTCSDGTAAVLKIGFAEENSIIHSEAKILNYLAGVGAVKLLAYDEKLCAILLERLLPGENLIDLCKRDDARATEIAIGVMKNFRRPVPAAGEFPPLEKWIESLLRVEETAFSPEAIKRAQKYFSELIFGSRQNFLLHGDLHHENILSAQREPFLAIDPKGIIGDIGFEISVFLNNPRGWVLKHPKRDEILRTRLEMFARSFEIEREKLRKWGYSEAVLAAWWTFEDNGADYEKWLACADMWEQLKI